MFSISNIDEPEEDESYDGFEEVKDLINARKEHGISRSKPKQEMVQTR